MKSTIAEIIQGGIGAAAITVPTLSFTDDIRVQFGVTLFIGLYGAAINVLGSKEKITKRTFTRGVFTGGFVSCMVWLGGQYMSLNPILTALTSGAIAYSGDKKFKEYINKFLEGSAGK